MENPIKMYDLGVPLFSETSKSKKIIHFQFPHVRHIVKTVDPRAWILDPRENMGAFDSLTDEGIFFRPGGTYCLCGERALSLGRGSDGQKKRPWLEIDENPAVLAILWVIP